MTGWPVLPPIPGAERLVFHPSAFTLIWCVCGHHAQSDRQHGAHVRLVASLCRFRVGLIWRAFA